MDRLARITLLAMASAAAAFDDFDDENDFFGIANSSNSTPTPVPGGGEVGTLKTAVLAGGWIPFTIVIVISISFACSYVWYYQHKREKELCSTLMSIFGLTVALLTIALVPIDIYLVSSMKNPNGDFESWATESIVDHVKDLSTKAYYCFYALDISLAFVFMPFAYFLFEEKDEEMNVGLGKRIFGACKFTFVFIMVMVILLAIGAFAYNSDGDAGCIQDWNSSTYQKYITCRTAYAEKVLTSSGGNNALSFAIGILVALGYIYFCVYTATGMVYLPISMIRSRGRSSQDDVLLEDRRAENAAKQDQLRNKKKKSGRKTMSARDNRRLLNSKEEDRIVNRAEKRMKESDGACCGKVKKVLRPFEWLFGFLFFILSLFFAICLTMTTTDKLMQLQKQHPIDYKHGYRNITTTVLNPVDWILTKSHSLFPVDYIIITGIVYYFVICTFSGIKNLGVRFCHLKMYSIKPSRTVPQGLLFFIFIVLFVILAFNVVLTTLAPTYVTYGNQAYPILPTPVLTAQNDRTCDSIGVYPGQTAQCDPTAPSALYMIRKGNGSDASNVYHTNMAQLIQVDGNQTRIYADNWGKCNTQFISDILAANKALPPCKPDGTANSKEASIFTTLKLTTSNMGEFECRQRNGPCNQTRMAALLNAFFFKVWFLGALYYWANWLFLLVFFVSFIYHTCKRRKSLMQAMINDVQNDFDDSDDDMSPAKFSWA